MNLNNYDTVIFDYNGTIIDDVDSCLAIANVLLAAYDLPALDKEGYLQAFCFPIEDYYRKIGLLEKGDFQELAQRFITECELREDDLHYFPDIPRVCGILRELGKEEIILSACQQDVLTAQMQQLGLSEYFSEIIGIKDIYAAGKEDIALQWRQANPDKRALLLGDCDHDQEIAELLGADCVLISRGHMAEDRLKQCGVPVFASVQAWLQSALNEN